MHHPGITSRRIGRALAFGALIALPFAIANAPAARADLLEEIKQRGTFVVGTEARFPPFEFVEGGEIVGYSADMMEHIKADNTVVKATTLYSPIMSASAVSVARLIAQNRGLSDLPELAGLAERAVRA